MQYELCPHGKCTTYPGWHKCEKCEKNLQRLLKLAKKKSERIYHTLRYAIDRLEVEEE